MSDSPSGPSAPASPASSLLEALIRQGMAGAGEEQALIMALLDAELYLPSAQEVSQDGSGILPLILADAQGQPLVAAYTDPAHVDAEARAKAPWCLKVPAKWLIGSLSDELGLILFAGPELHCTFPPAAIAALRGLTGE